MFPLRLKLTPCNVYEAPLLCIAPVGDHGAEAEDCPMLLKRLWACLLMLCLLASVHFAALRWAFVPAVCWQHVSSEMSGEVSKKARLCKVRCSKTRRIMLPQLTCISRLHALLACETLRCINSVVSNDRQDRAVVPRKHLLLCYLLFLLL